MSDIREILWQKQEQIEHLTAEIKMLRAAAEIISKETNGTSVYFDFVTGEAEEAVAEAVRGPKSWPKMTPATDGQ